IAVEAQVGAEGGDGEPGLLGELARPRGRRDVPGRHVGVAGPLDALEAGGRGLVGDGVGGGGGGGDGAVAGSAPGGARPGGGGLEPRRKAIAIPVYPWRGPTSRRTRPAPHGARVKVTARPPRPEVSTVMSRPPRIRETLTRSASCARRCGVPARWRETASWRWVGSETLSSRVRPALRSSTQAGPCAVTFCTRPSAQKFIARSRPARTACAVS